MKEFKPKQSSYLFQATVFSIVLILAGLAWSLASTVFDQGVVGILPASIVVALLIVWYQRGKFRRETYWIGPDSFRMQRGSWFTAQDITLEGKKVTDVELRKPFIRYWLFGTGDIYVQTAGGSGAEITFRDVSHPQELFATVQETLRNSGHRLSSDTELHRTAPTQRGAVLGALGNVGALIGFMLIAAGNILVMANGPILLGVALGGLAVALAIGIWSYRDTIRRDYQVFEDRVEIHEGWLTRHHIVIPGEKLSDSKTTQGLLDRVLGLHTVVVSSKGSGGEFDMRYVADAPAVEASVEQVESSLSELATYEESSVEQPTTRSQSTGEDWRLQPSVLRSAMPWVVLGLLGIIVTAFAWVLPVLGFAIIGAGLSFGIAALQAILYANTEYTITDDSVVSAFDFVVSTRTNFSFEKVTGVIERRSPLDYVFGTKQLSFWSIGSDNTLSMRHLDLADDVLQDVLEKHGIRYDEKLTCYEPSFDISTFLVAFLPAHILVLAAVLVTTLITPFGFFTAAATIAVYGGLLTYFTFYYRRASVDLYQNDICVTRGIVYRTRHHLNMDDVKDISSTTYPLVSAGSLTLNVAGERVIQTNNGSQRIPYQTGIRFLPGVRDIHRAINNTILGKPHSATTTQDFHITGQPSLYNLFLLAGVLLPLTLVFIWLLPVFVLRRRYMWYGVADEHVVSRTGIFFKEETTIRYGKIDHVNQSRGWRNKVCGNTSVMIQTTGSGAAEMTLLDIDNAERFMDYLDEQQNT